jgi:hypothetical protein
VAGKTGQDIKWQIQQLRLFMWLLSTLRDTLDTTSNIQKITVSKAGGAGYHNF